MDCDQTQVGCPSCGDTAHLWWHRGLAELPLHIYLRHERRRVFAEEAWGRELTGDQHEGIYACTGCDRSFRLDACAGSERNNETSEELPSVAP